MLKTSRGTMLVKRLEDFKGGWFLGNFEPTLLKTEQFEVAVHRYKKGQQWPKHYHEFTTEYNCVISGRMRIQDTIFADGDLFVIHPMEVADPEFLEDCVLVIVKTPSIPGDKILV
jgi:quercetin dioxygenase-like cupin family protein